MLTYTIRTDVKGKRTLATDAVFTTGDVQAYRLQFVFYDNGVYDATGCSLMVKGKRPDGAVVIDEGVIDRLGNAFYDVKSSMYAVPGELALEVALLTKDGGYITVKELAIFVREGFGEGNLAEDTAPLLTELHKTLEEAKEVTEKARPIGDVVANEEGRILAETERLKAEEQRIIAEKERVQGEKERTATENERIAAETERQAAYEQMGNLFSNALVGSASGSSVCLDDVSPVEHKAEVKVSGLENLEGVTLVQSGINLFNPIAVTTTSLVYENMTEPNMSYRTLKNDYGTRINSTSYDKDAGIIVTQEDTKSDNTTPVGNVQGGFFYMYFDAARYQFAQFYTFMADVEILDNWGTDNSIIFRSASSTDNIVYPFNNTTQRVRFVIKATQSTDHPGRRCIEIMNRGKSMVFKNIMWLPGNCAADTEYEDYKETKYTVNADGTVDNVVLYHPCSNLIPDTSGARVECKYNKDSNKVIEKLTNAIISLGGNV